MAVYRFLAIRTDDVTWSGYDSTGEGSFGNEPGPFPTASQFVINDKSKLEWITITDDDGYLEASDYDPRSPDNPEPQIIPDGLGVIDDGAAVWAGGIKEISEFPGSRIVNLVQYFTAPGLITFAGVEPDQILEGVIYNMEPIPDDGGSTYSENSAFTPPQAYADLITCFTIGTLIETSEGNKPVEELQPGDMIATMDDGYQPVRWIGSTRRDAIDLARNPKLRPVCIPAGALGGGLPKRNLLVSRQHRILVRSRIAQRMFGIDEILIPAIRLVSLNGIRIVEDIEQVIYFHILFDKHQVIFSEDAPTESLFTGPEALKSVSPAARKEIETLFPDICEPDFVVASARPIPAGGAQVRKLVERHRKHGLPLLNG